MQITTVGVVGSGTMGSGIAQVAIQHGFQVFLYDINEEIVDQSLSKIFSRLERLCEKGKLSKEEYEAAMQRIQTTTDLVSLKDCQIIIEAAPEKIEIKRTIFQELGNNCPEGTILATNTSSFSITEIGNMTKYPSRVVGMHFFNPAPIMPLVEIIRGLRTSNETVNTLCEFACDLKKSPVTCEDTPGFIVNRVARPFYNEALKIMKEQLATVDQVDRIMKKAGNFKMGPFELQDLIGIDINFATTESVHAGFFGESRFRPHHYQQRMVQSGQLGRKVGGGFFEYDK